MTKLEIILNDQQVKVLQQEISNLISYELSNMKKDTESKQKYMNKKQTCEYLQISNNTLDCWIEKGLPLIKINGILRFDSVAIDNWLSNNV